MASDAKKILVVGYPTPTIPVDIQKQIRVKKETLNIHDGKEVYWFLYSKDQSLEAKGKGILKCIRPYVESQPICIHLRDEDDHIDTIKMVSIKTDEFTIIKAQVTKVKIISNNPQEVLSIAFTL